MTAPQNLNDTDVFKAINYGKPIELQELIRSGKHKDILAPALRRVIELLGFMDPYDKNRIAKLDRLFNMADMLIKDGVPIDTECWTTTILDRFIMHHRIHELKDCLNKNEIVENQFISLISTACTSDKEDVALMLISLGLQKYDLSQTTLLHSCAYKETFRAAKKLLEIGIDIDHANHYGRTALHAAAAEENEKMILFLLQNGANPTIKDSEDLIPIDFVEKKDSQSYSILSCAIERHHLDNLAGDHEIDDGLSF